MAKIPPHVVHTAARQKEDLGALKERDAAVLSAKDSALQKLQSTTDGDPAEMARLRTELEAARTSSNVTINTLRGENKKVIAERDHLASEVNQLKTGLQAEKERLER